MIIYTYSFLCFMAGFTFAYITRLVFGGVYKMLDRWYQ